MAPNASRVSWSKVHWTNKNSSAWNWNRNKTKTKTMATITFVRTMIHRWILMRPDPGVISAQNWQRTFSINLFVSPSPFRSKGSIQSGYADATNWPLTVDAESSPKGYRSIFECIPQQVYRLRAARRSYQFGRFATIHSRRISHIESSMKHNNNYMYKIRYLSIFVCAAHVRQSGWHSNKKRGRNLS